MQRILFVFLFMVLQAAVSRSQDGKQIQVVPELEEWWRAPADEVGLGRYGVSYLPKFYHGRDAMAISVKSGMMETWLNRFPGDRENVFTWKGGGPILTGDFNGDGVTDYIDGRGNVYRGITNGEPPDTAVVKALGLFVADNWLISDFNADGFDDVIALYKTTENSTLATLFYGSSDLVQMERRDLVRTMKGIKQGGDRFPSVVYRMSNGAIRLVLGYYTPGQNPNPYLNGYEVYEIAWLQGSREPNAKFIGEYKVTAPVYSKGSEAIYRSSQHERVYMLAVSSDQKSVHVFDLTKDSIEKVNTLTFDGAVSPAMLGYSIDGDQYEDWYYYKNVNDIVFMSGSNLPNGASTAHYKSICPDEYNQYFIGAGVLSVIGDVNGDSVLDIAMGTGSNMVANCFRLVLSNNRVSGVDYDPKTVSEIYLDVPLPHPVERGGRAVVRCTVEQSGNYRLALYTLEGREISNFYNGSLEKGITTIAIDWGSVIVPSGAYLLRFVNAKETIISQRLLIIQ